MAETAQIELLPAAKVAQQTPLHQALNGICFTSFSDTKLDPAELEQVVNAIPTAIAKALSHRGYYFVPLTIHEGDDADLAIPDSGETLVADGYSTELSDRAICHRNVKVGSSECTFISTRLMREKFALAFELFINVGHHFVDAVGVPKDFATLAWSQAETNVRGETSQDAWENRRRAIEGADVNIDEVPIDTEATSLAESPVKKKPVDEKAKLVFLEAAFSDSLAIYMLSLALDFDYADLREREYPLLGASALAERLRHVAHLFPPNPGYEFQIRYRRRGLS
jgi:hypothetical protein